MTMNARNTAIAALLCLAAIAFPPLYAQSNYGVNKQILIRALEASAQGDCPGNLMSAMLQDACERQMPGMGQSLRNLGAISGADYKGMQQTPSGPAEVYRVRFANGTMTWMINLGPDGKIVVLWSGG